MDWTDERTFAFLEFCRSQKKCKNFILGGGGTGLDCCMPPLWHLDKCHLFTCHNPWPGLSTFGQLPLFNLPHPLTWKGHMPQRPWILCCFTITRISDTFFTLKCKNRRLFYFALYSHWLLQRYLTPWCFDFIWVISWLL